VDERRNRELARELDGLAKRYVVDVREDAKVVVSDFLRFARMLEMFPTE
jgi:hypothetical protein